MGKKLKRIICVVLVLALAFTGDAVTYASPRAEAVARTVKEYYDRELPEEMDASLEDRYVNLGLTAHENVELFIEPDQYIGGMFDESIPKPTVTEDGVVYVPGGFCGTILIDVGVKIYNDSSHNNFYGTGDVEYIEVNPIKDEIVASDITVESSLRDQIVPIGATHKSPVPLRYYPYYGRIKVDEDGNIKIPAGYSGTDTITIRSAESGIYQETDKRITITVIDVHLSDTAKSIFIDKSATLKLVGASGKVKWKSSKTSVAKVDANGKVYGIKPGTAKITATYNGDKYVCNVTVRNPFITRSAVSVGKNGKFTLKLKGADAKSWKSSNSAIASVDKKGVVKGKKNGKVTITCTTKNGKKIKCKVVVFKSESSIYKTLVKFKKKLPEGKRWTNDDYYQWKGGTYRGGYGCAGFAFMLSDAVFGSRKAYVHQNYRKVLPGDIVRINNDGHSVIVIKVTSTGVVVAEGNYNSSVHWGREFTFEELEKCGTYVMSRY